MKLFRYGYIQDGKNNSITIAVDYQWQAEIYFYKHFPDAENVTLTVEEMLYGRSVTTLSYHVIVVMNGKQMSIILIKI